MILSNHVARMRDYNVDIVLEVFQHKDRVECAIMEANSPRTREVEVYDQFDVDGLVREIRNFAVRHSRLTVWQRHIYDSLLTP